MSTMIALFLVLSTLAGCASETLINVKNAIPPPPAPVVTYTVELETYEDSFQDEDGSDLARCVYEIPVLKADRPEGDAACETFNREFDTWRDNGAGIARAAKEDRPFMNSAAVYSDELRCSVYQTGRLISVAGTYVTYTGGAHPNTILLSWNFDLESGAFFDAATLDDEARFHDAVVQALNAQAALRARESGLAPRDFFWEDYQDTLENWSSYAVSFGEAGMSVMFSPYELACYAAGPQVFEIPYEDLAPHLGSQGRALLGLE